MSQGTLFPGAGINNSAGPGLRLCFVLCPLAVEMVPLAFALISTLVPSSEHHPGDGSPCGSLLSEEGRKRDPTLSGLC